MARSPDWDQCLPGPFRRWWWGSLGVDLAAGVGVKFLESCTSIHGAISFLVATTSGQLRMMCQKLFPSSATCWRR